MKAVADALEVARSHLHEKFRRLAKPRTGPPPCSSMNSIPAFLSTASILRYVRVSQRPDAAAVIRQCRSGLSTTTQHGSPHRALSCRFTARAHRLAKRSSESRNG